jgi:hypothetical protein
MYSYRLCRNFDFTFSTRGFSERIGWRNVLHSLYRLRTAGPSDIIDDGVNGFLTPEGDEEPFTQKIKIFNGSIPSFSRTFQVPLPKKMETWKAAFITKNIHIYKTIYPINITKTTALINENNCQSAHQRFDCCQYLLSSLMSVKIFRNMSTMYLLDKEWATLDRRINLFQILILA